MIFHYFEITPKIVRPIIPIILKSQTKLMLYSALIDSGADYSIFSLDIADALGIKLQLKDKVKFIGVGRENIDGFWSKIEIIIGDITYETHAIFAEISEFGHGILGQKGFFDHFDVELSYKKQLIEIKSVIS
ncbi:MAG: hypothetical protein AAB600_04400 [Patescibacteria group bacterium]